MLHGEENMVSSNAGCTSVENRPEHDGRWRSGRSLPAHKLSALYNAKREIKKTKAQVRAKI